MLQDITASPAKAEKKKSEGQAVKDVLAAEREVIAEDKRIVEEDLMAAKPALDEAEAALSAITQKDIVMLKSLKKPPEVIKRLFDVFDQDRSGTVDHHELAVGLTVLCEGSPEEKLRAMFDMFDRDRSGRISRYELSALF